MEQHHKKVNWNFDTEVSEAYQELQKSTLKHADLIKNKLDEIRKICPYAEICGRKGEEDNQWIFHVNLHLEYIDKTDFRKWKREIEEIQEKLKKIDFNL